MSANNKTKMRKGQAFTSDFLLSAVIFITIIFAAPELWNMAASKYSGSDSSKLMQDKAFSITDTLIKTEGYPKGWTNSTVKIIGLSEETPQVLNKSKLFEMKNISYQGLKTIWGVGDFEVFLNFTDSSGSTINLSGVLLGYGQPPTNQKDLMPLNRLVLINDSGNLTRSIMKFAIWR